MLIEFFIVKKLGDTVISNYYDFETNVVDMSAFDTTECFPAEIRKDFIMTFSYKDIITYPELKNSYIRLMEQFAFYALAKETNETVMRFSPPKVLLLLNLLSKLILLLSLY